MSMPCTSLWCCASWFCPRHFAAAFLRRSSDDFSSAKPPSRGLFTLSLGPLESLKVSLMLVFASIESGGDMQAILCGRWWSSWATPLSLSVEVSPHSLSSRRSARTAAPRRATSRFLFGSPRLVAVNMQRKPSRLHRLQAPFSSTSHLHLERRQAVQLFVSCGWVTRESGMRARRRLDAPSPPPLRGPAVSSDARWPVAQHAVGGGEPTRPRHRPT